MTTEPRQAPTDGPRVSVCIVSFNTRDLLRTCLRSLAAATTCPVEVILVDNASADGSAEMVAREFPGVRLVRSASNVGFAAAANVAMREARGETVLWLNPDTVVPPGAIDRLLAFLETHPAVDVCGPALIYPDGTFQTCGRRFPSIATEVHDAVGDRWLRGPLRGWRRRRPATAGPVDWICGACVLVRQEALARVGFFDEQFFLYGEELDWFARARAVGIAAWVVPDVEVVHHLGQSAASIGPASNAHLGQTRLLYYRKHRARGHAALVAALHLAHGVWQRLRERTRPAAIGERR